MKRVLIALMMCLISIVGFAQNFEICSDTVYITDPIYITDTIYSHDTVFITADNDTIPVGAPEDLPDDNDTEYSMVYPNPTYTGQFTLLYVDYDMPVRLYSPTGVLIKETTRNGYGCCIPFIELADSRYPNGSYIIEYWYQGRRYAEFIIVIK